jgi:NitT/TauT family transport system ATP-binding protein
MAGIGVKITAVERVFPNGVRALSPISLDLAPGEFVSIVGPSGCGKSTLLRLVAKLDQPQAGAIQLDPAPADRADQVEYARQYPHKTAFVFQDAQLLPWRNVLRNVAVPLELMHVAKEARLVAAREAIAQVGLADAADRYPNQLSGGMKMRVSLARAMVTQPRLLLMDEPFAALDEITRQRLDEQLLSLWSAHGTTVIFVTHSIAEAVFLSQRVIVMSRRPGRILLDREIELPSKREAGLRSSAEFASQTKDLFETLRQESEVITAEDAP